MKKPVLLVVDDDPQVLAAVRRDLRSRYREHYTIVSAASGEEALDHGARAEEPRRFAGHDHQRSADAGHARAGKCWRRSRDVYPLARRVLLTAYSDIDAAIKGDQRGASRSLSVEAVGSARGAALPVIDDLLDAWQAEYLPEAKGLRLVGHQWSPRSHAIKDFLASNLIPYRWLDVDAGSGRARAARCGGRRRRRAARHCSSKTDRRCCAIRSPARWPSASADRSRPPSSCTTS